MKRKQKPKATPHRITALLLALLLTAATLSPAMTASAAEATDTTQNNTSSTGGGHQVPDCDLSFKYGYSSKDKDGSSVSVTRTIYVNREGNIVLRSYVVDGLSDINSNNIERAIYIFSDKPFTYSGREMFNNNGDVTFTDYKEEASLQKNGYYFTLLPTFVLSKDDKITYTFSGFVNPYTFSTYNGENGFGNKFNVITKDLDLTKDDWKSDEDIANMTPVRDESIGYLPSARYFDDRKKNLDPVLGYDFPDITSTISWDNFLESYYDSENPYYVEIYAKLHYTTGHRKEGNPSVWESDSTPSMAMYRYKKYGEIKYTSGRIDFSYYDAHNAYFKTIDVLQDASGNKVNPDSDTNISAASCYVSEYYVRLLHYDYDKQQLLCGGFTKLAINDNGGSTSSPGDFSDNDPDGDWKPDENEPDKDWDDTGNETDPSNPDPDNPSPDIDTSDIGTFILSIITSLLNAIKSILSLVGEFPDLIRHVFSFLPDEIFYMMFLGTSAIVLMRFLGR